MPIRNSSMIDFPTEEKIRPSDPPLQNMNKPSLGRGSYSGVDMKDDPFTIEELHKILGKQSQ